MTAARLERMDPDCDMDLDASTAHTVECSPGSTSDTANRGPRKLLDVSSSSDCASSQVCLYDLQALTLGTCFAQVEHVSTRDPS